MTGVYSQRVKYHTFWVLIAIKHQEKIADIHRLLMVLKMHVLSKHVLVMRAMVKGLVLMG